MKAMRIAPLAAITAASLLLGACGESETAEKATDTESSASETTAAAKSALSISGLWARTSPMVASAGAAYLTIDNSGDTDDELLTASVDASIAAKVELHETVAVEGGATESSMMPTAESTEAPMMNTGATGSAEAPMMGTGTTGAPMMEMRPVTSIAAPAGGQAILKPGGYHIMLLELAKPLEVGTTIEITLTFKEAGEMVVSVPVRDTAP